MNECQIKFQSNGFEERQFNFNGQSGLAYVKQTDQGRICITDQHDLTYPTTLDDPIRVYELYHPSSDEDDVSYYILHEAADYPTATDYFEWIEYEKTQPVITFCPSCFCIMNNDPITFDITPHQDQTDEDFNRTNKHLFDCSCGEDFIYLDEITKINLLKLMIKVR
jgi:hypothetical protein